MLNYTSYIRCINKDDLSYVDIRVSRGHNVVKIYLPLLKYADEYSGNWSEGKSWSGKVPKEPKKYHYFVIINDDDDCIYYTGIMKEKRVIYFIEVDKNTLEIKNKVSLRKMNNKMCEK